MRHARARGEVPNVAAKTLADYAIKKAADERHMSPFAYSAQAHGHRYVGGKVRACNFTYCCALLSSWLATVPVTLGFFLLLLPLGAGRACQSHHAHQCHSCARSVETHASSCCRWTTSPSSSRTSALQIPSQNRTPHRARTQRPPRRSRVRSSKQVCPPLRLGAAIASRAQRRRSFVFRPAAVYDVSRMCRLDLERAL